MKSRIFTVFSSFLIFSCAMIAPAHAEKSNLNNVPVNQAPQNIQQTGPTTSASPLFGSISDDPLAEMEKTQQGLGKVVRETYRRMKNYQQAGKFFEPDADFVEEPNQYVLKVDLPGMQKDQINIQANKTDLTISGERKTERQYKSEKDGIQQWERSSGSFNRSISLPADANSDAVSAKYENGVLEVTIPKLTPEKTQAKKVKIQ